jgi:hypothetical protein
MQSEKMEERLARVSIKGPGTTAQPGDELTPQADMENMRIIEPETGQVL